MKRHALVSRRGFLGGALAPGIEISLDALASRAAQLRKVELVEPRSPIGKSTVEALQSGILYGFAGQVDGMVRRLRLALSPDDPEGVEVIDSGPAAEADAGPPLCKVCGQLIEAGPRMLCVKCKAPHHQDCWEFIGSCSIFGCNSKEGLLRR